MTRPRIHLRATTGDMLTVAAIVVVALASLLALAYLVWAATS